MRDKRQIIKLLARHKQRATYGALAEVVGGNYRNVMSEYTDKKTPENSWIVTKKKRQPTGYTEEQKSPHLRNRAHVITTGAKLSAWLKSPH